MRFGNLFWGITILILGILLLLNNLGIININVWGIFGAVLLILLGAWLLFGRYIAQKDDKEQAVNIPLEFAPEAKITFSHGAGRLFIHGNPGSSDLVSGTITGGIDVDIDRQDKKLKVHLETPHEWFLGIPPAGWQHSRDWRLALTDQIPLSLNFKTGASQSEIDLEPLQIKELKISTGASQADIILPSHAGFTDVKLESGAANTSLKIPVGVSARIRFTGGLAKIDIDTSRFPQSNNYYQSPDYDSAANRVNIQIDTGVGSVSIL